MNTNDKILKVLEVLQADIAVLKTDMTVLKTDVTVLKTDGPIIKDAQAHTTTAIEAVAAGQKEQVTKQDVEAAVDAAKSELKADIYILNATLIKKVQSHEKRITNIEEKEHIPNPDKN
jgi:hypothetical protein